MLASMAIDINIRTLPLHTSADGSHTVSNATTKFIPCGGAGLAVHSAQLVWHDAASNGTVTLESSNQPGAGIDSTDAKLWSPEPTTITGPVGSAEGSEMIHIGNSKALKYRLRYVALADSEISLWICG